MAVSTGAHVRSRKSRIRFLRAGIFGLCGVLIAVDAAFADGAIATAALAAPHNPSAVVVAYEANMSGSARAQALARAELSHGLGAAPVAHDVERITLPAGVTATEAIKRLENVPGVRFAEPDYWMEPLYEPDDPYFRNGGLWGMYGDATLPSNRFGSGAGEAWSAGAVGSADVFVGIVDEGFDHRHPDLAANAWTNPFDPVDGRDNDGNGYVDDVNGWDFYHGDNTVFDGRLTNDVDSHGTHVAGIVGAQGGNGAGVAGVNWAATMISAKFLGPTGGSSSGAIRALDYLTDLRLRHGLNIVATNNSWGYTRGYGQALVEAIGRGGDAGILFVAAAGNNGTNNDNTPFNPASFRCTTRQDNGQQRGFDCITSVAAITASGAKASFSNFGAKSVDLGAPGATIRSTYPHGRYSLLSGTSMATPHVTGAIALCAAVNPGLDPQQLRAALLGSTEPTSSLDGKTLTGGRLDVGAMLSRCDPPAEFVVGSAERLEARLVSTDTVLLEWVDGAQNERAYEIQRATWEASACGAWQRVDRIGRDQVSHQVHGVVAGASYCFRVGALGSLTDDGWVVWSNEALLDVPAGVPGPPRDVRGVAGDGSATVEWSPPLSDGGSPVLGYTVRSDVTDATCTTASELSCVVAPLINGTDYRFTVTAVNAVGASPPSQPSSAVRPATTPDAPTNAGAVAGDGRAVVSWQPPAWNGGSAISSYVVTSSPGERTCSTSATTACTVTGLVNGTAYVFTVRAFNSVGGGPPSEPSPPVTPHVQQVAPDVSAPKVTLFAPQTIGTNVFVRVAWQAMQSDEGDVTYELQKRRGSGSWQSIALSSPTATSVKTGLAPGATYTFRLRSTVTGMLPGAWRTSEPRTVVLRQEGAAVYTGSFVRAPLEGASGGYVQRANSAASTARVAVDGGAVAFVTTVGPARGMAEIWLDGRLITTLDMYSPEKRTRRVVWVTALAVGAHELEIRPTGTKHRGSTSTRIDVDAFLVLH